MALESRSKGRALPQRTQLARADFHSYSSATVVPATSATIVKTTHPSQHGAFQRSVFSELGGREGAGARHEQHGGDRGSAHLCRCGCYRLAAMT
eukprot:COSAG06_NODE_5962_length_3182_cov_11.158936_1_plen_94_part_00